MIVFKLLQFGFVFLLAFVDLEVQSRNRHLEVTDKVGVFELLLLDEVCFLLELLQQCLPFFLHLVHLVEKVVDLGLKSLVLFLQLSKLTPILCRVLIRSGRDRLER